MTRRLAAAAVATVVLQAATAGWVWLDVPYVRQPEEGCGAASLSMVMQYWHVRGAAGVSPAAVETIFEELFEPARKGIPASKMAPYLVRQGFEAFVFRGDWSDLEHHLAAGRPLIVAFEPGRGTLHYAVAAGIGDDAIALNDPADRKLREYSRRDFEQRWESTGRWTLLAVPAAR